MERKAACAGTYCFSGSVSLFYTLSSFLRNIALSSSKETILIWNYGSFIVFFIFYLQDQDPEMTTITSHTVYSTDLPDHFEAALQVFVLLYPTLKAHSLVPIIISTLPTIICPFPSKKPFVLQLNKLP